MPKTITAPSIDCYFLNGDGTHVGDIAWDPLVLHYKGATAKIETSIVSGVTDTRVTFKSSKPKLVSVDAAGNVKALADTKGEVVEITAYTSDDSVYDRVYVEVDLITPKSLKLDQTKVKGSVDPRTESFQFDLMALTDSITDAMNVPVTFSVTGGTGLKIYQGITDASGNWPAIATDPASFDEPTRYAYTCTKRISVLNGAPRSQIHLMAVEGGVYTVTVECLGKKATCTVTVDGFTRHGAGFEPTADAQYLKNGKPVTGWISWQGNEGRYFFGKDVFKAPTGWPENAANFMAVSGIYYIDPATKKPIAAGVHKIDKKLYAFDDGGELHLFTDWKDGVYQVVPGERYYYDPVTKTDRYYYGNADGTLATGWVDVTTTYHYFDPATGFRAEKSWVPVRNGKGVTWVNANGDTLDDDGRSLDNAGAVNPDGFHKIDGGIYFFTGGYKKSARATGWVYVKYDSGASAFLPATAKTGTHKVYCDPNNNGRVLENQFWVGGKEYMGLYGIVETGHSLVFLPGNYAADQFDLKGVKYLRLGRYVFGPDGSLLRNAMVKAVDYLTGESYTVYAAEDGFVVEGEWVTVKGKSYFFDGYGRRVESTMTAAETSLWIRDGADWSAVEAVPIKAGKPEQGFYYYYQGKKLINMLVRFGPDGSSSWPYLALDKNGKPAVNTVIDVRVDYASSQTCTYAAGKDGKVFYSDWPASGYGSYVVEIKGKLYATEPESGRVRKDGLVPIEYGWDQEVEAVGYADKNGVLARNTFKDVPGLAPNPVTLYFNGDGSAAYQTSGVFIVKGKVYLEYTLSPYGCPVSAVYKPEKAGWTTEGDTICINKDGSIKTGLLTRPDGKRMYFGIRGGTLDVLDCWFYDFDNDFPVVWKIGNKIYLFNDDYEMVTGWVYFDRVGLADFASNRVTAVTDHALMYFDPKTGAAAAGGWKSVPKPVAYGDELSYGAEDIGMSSGSNVFGKPVNADSKKAKLYFTAEGWALHSTAETIKGKRYAFAADGTATLSAGWLDSLRLRYMLKNGTLATGRQKIDGQYYYFEANGMRLWSPALRKTGSKWYFYDENGVQATPAVGSYGAYTVGSTTGAALTTVWNKDGSLKSVVYAGTNRPAAGESVVFGTWSTDLNVQKEILHLGDDCGCYVLDGKGLPVTGAVTDFRLTGFIYPFGFIVNADGSHLNGGSYEANALALCGKQYYVMDGALLATPQLDHLLYNKPALTNANRMLTVERWGSLPAADQKAMEIYAGQGWDLGLYPEGKDGDNGDRVVQVFVRPDGSAMANTVEELNSNALNVHGAVHTNRFGVPLEVYTPIYKVGSKWFVDAEKLSSYSVLLMVWSNDDLNTVRANMRTKANGELIGFYDAQTGKGITGVVELSFSVGSQNYWGGMYLSKGKPVGGRSVVMGETIDTQEGMYFSL
ncbi:MAG: hypothetical protein IJ594_08980 [Oscillospiraceae bacterium]|nr:hypothetical protein [Oscillospiraceae bacterium]